MQEFSKVINPTGVITGLFPIPVYKKSLNRTLTSQEIKITSPEYWKSQPGSDNKRTSSTKVLDASSFFQIKQYILSGLNEFVQEVYAPETSFSLYITQSWINFNTKGDSHHKHYHSNSILSGVMYFKTNDGDAISFYGDRKDNIHIVNTPNWWNMKRIAMPIFDGDLVIFPSTLEHGVEKITRDDDTRISLAFNTWFTGELGSEEGLTKLVL